MNQVKDLPIVRSRTSSPRSAVKQISGGRSTRYIKSRFTDSSGSRVPDSPVESTETQVWHPQASLTGYTSAPLASRITICPLSSSAPYVLLPKSFGELSVEEQENAIIDDLLYVLMGFEGRYICYHKSYNPHDEKARLLGPTFTIRPGLDPSLREICISMLKMASHYIAVETFLEIQSREEYGTVNHALCAALRKLMNDYLTLIVQLENEALTNETFTLHLLNLHTKSSGHMLYHMHTLVIELSKANSILEDDMNSSSDDSEGFDEILENICDGGGGSGGMSVKKTCKGGSVLGLITRQLSTISGDAAAKALLTYLLREASKPYMVMLNEWLHHGGIKDPHNEFLVKEQTSIKREKLDQDYTDEYWEKRYTIREHLVPPQLESVRDKVLLAGKYLNVVRECGGVDVSKEVKDVPESFDDPQFLENVVNAYAHANSSLLNLLLTTHALPARLRSLKHYFFLDRSDFFSYFLELGASELKKPVKTVNIGKLQSLLDIVLRQPGSVAAEDGFKEDVKVLMNEHSLTNWLMKIVNVTGLDQDTALTLPNYSTSTAAVQQSTNNQSSSMIVDDKNLIGYDALVFDYAMPFPLSLVVSRVTLTRYQLLFRYLLSLRYLETLLVGSWIDHGKMMNWKFKSPNKRVEIWKRRAWTLRARMLVFVQQLLYYCTSEVIEPNWQALMSRISSSQVIEAPTSMDGDFLVHDTQAAYIKPNSAVDQPYAKRTVDELMQDHVDFLATCLKECMLTNSKLLRINSKILLTCTMFANYTTSLSRYLAAANAELSSRDQPGNTDNGGTGGTNSPGKSINGDSGVTESSSKLDKLFNLLQKYEDNFSRHLKILLDTLNYLAATETVVFLSLCARLSTANQGMGNSANGASNGNSCGVNHPITTSASGSSNNVTCMSHLGDVAR